MSNVENQAAATSLPPPYPRLGEIYRVLARALDTKNNDRKLDAFARGEVHDWLLPEHLRERLFRKPLEKAAGTEFSAAVAEFIEEMDASYKNLVLEVSVGAMSREDTLPILIEHYFVPRGADILEALQKQHHSLNMSDVARMLSDSETPINIILSCYEQRFDCNLAKLAFPTTAGDDKTARESVDDWRKGKKLPDLASIKRFSQALLKNSNENKNQSQKIDRKTLNDLTAWLVIARALNWIEREHHQPLRRLLLRQLWTPNQTDIHERLASINHKSIEKYQDLIKPWFDLNKRLSPHSEKEPGEKERCYQALKEFQRLNDQIDPEGRTRHYLEHLWGRWYVLSGEPANALKHYLVAVDHADYRDVEKQQHIVREALILTAYLMEFEIPIRLSELDSVSSHARTNPRSVLKKLKSLAIFLEILPAPIPEQEMDKQAPSERAKKQDILEPWEVEEWSNHFTRHFRPEGRFQEAYDHDKAPLRLSIQIIHFDEIDRIKPDLRAPHREISLLYADGSKSKKPQLLIFTLFRKVEHVRALLERDPTVVNDIDKRNASALLVALEDATITGQVELLDLLLQYPHSPSTLNEVTPKRRLSIPHLAVEYGAPQVMKKILEMGANPNLRSDIVYLSPLYFCALMLQQRLYPEDVRMAHKMHEHHNLMEKRDFYRRYPGLDPTGNPESFRRLMASPEAKEIMDVTQAFFQNRLVERTSKAKLLKIAELLLQHGANPNAIHRRRLPDKRTPLLMAAEVGDPDLFDLMIRYGGDPEQRDADGHNCMQIAIGFGRPKIVEYLRNREAKR